MRILDRYAIKSFIWPFLYCLVVFIGMYIIIDLFGHLDEILRNKVEMAVLAKYYSLMVPIIFVQIVPVAMLLATIYVFGNLNRHNEILAMKSAGINVLKIVKPFLLTGIAVSLAVMLVNEKVVPRGSIIANKLKQRFIERIKGLPLKDNILKDVAIYGQDNRLFYIKEFDMPKRKLDEIIILEHDSHNRLVAKITAKSARWTSNGWLFSNCITYRLNNNGELIGKPIIYPKKIADIKETPRDFYIGQFQSELMNYSQLAEYVKKFSKVDKKIANRLAVDLYHKIAFPFISFIVVLLGVGFGLHTQRGGAFWTIGMSIALCFIYYGFMAVLLALGKGGWLTPQFAAWGANLVFLTAGVALLLKLAN